MWGRLGTLTLADILLRFRRPLGATNSFSVFGIPSEQNVRKYTWDRLYIYLLSKNYRDDLKGTTQKFS